MPTIKTRTLRLHQAEVMRWRQAWGRFFDRHFGIQGVYDACDVFNLADQHNLFELLEQEIDKAYDAYIGADNDPLWTAWVESLKYPEGLDSADLRLWPHSLPEPPKINDELLKQAATASREAAHAIQEAEGEEAVLRCLTPEVIACAYIVITLRDAKAVEAARSEAFGGW